MNEKPKRKTDWAQLDLGDEAILYTSTAEEIHLLNPTARVIWELCDGEHTLEDMAQALQSAFAVPEGTDLMADVARVLQTFATKGLLSSE